MEINLPYKVDISVNMMYYYHKYKKFLKKEAKMLRARIIEDVRKQLDEDAMDFDNTNLTIGIIFTENWYYKNGEVRRADLDNRLKFIIDSVFIAMALEDKHIFEIYAKKEQSDTAEYTSIVLNPVREEEL